MARKYRSTSISPIVNSQTASPNLTSPCLQNKPLPRLLRGWARIRHETSLFLRSIGLSIVVSTLSGYFQKDFKEPTKVAIPRNRVTATLRALIHVVPMSIALLEITWNWAGYYYGKQFERQAYYQIVAKTHEVLIQASLAVIVLSYILFESTFGEGIPFGAFLGSLQFLQIGYLWSPELWSSFTTFQLKRKICVLVLLIVSSLLAASAGPSSATLLIPRLIHWPLDPSHLAINGTFQDVWPDHMNSRNVPESCSVIPITDANSICPAGPWATLSQDFNVFASQYNATHQLRAVQVIQVSVPFILSNKLSTASPCLTSNELQQCGSTVQDVVLEGAQSAVSQWEQDVGFNKAFQDIKHYVSKDYYQPYTLASCLSDTITDTNMEEPIQFPHISETESELKQDRTTASLPNITKAQAFRAAGDESEFRLKWFDLAQTLSWDDVIGAVVLHPPTPGSDTINITTCTFGAGWGSSIATLYSSQDSSFFSNMYGTPKSWPTQEEEVFAEIVTISIPNYANLSGFAYPQRRITLITDWARFLNPIIPVTKDYNSSTIHLLLTSSPGNTDSIGIPKVLAGYLASGLARNGMNLEWQVRPNRSALCDDCLAFPVGHDVYGYGYDKQGMTTKLGIAVMIAYCALAFLHILYATSSGISSTAWDSTAELLALAMNSSPTRHLQNTCAGIIGIKTFRTTVRVRASQAEGDEDSHLELVFGEPEAHMSRLEVNREYGKVHVD